MSRELSKTLVGSKRLLTLDLLEPRCPYEALKGARKGRLSSSPHKSFNTLLGRDSGRRLIAFHWGA